MYFSIEMYNTAYLCTLILVYRCLAYICEDIFAQRIYVTVTSPYPRDWGVTIEKRINGLRNSSRCSGPTRPSSASL